MSDSAYQVMSLLFQGVTALAALWAVFVSIYIYNKKEAPKVYVKCKLGSHVSTHGILVSVCNFGDSTLANYKVGFEIGVFCKRRITMAPEGDSLRHIALLEEIPAGESADAFISWDVFESKYEFFFKRYFQDIMFSNIIRRSGVIVRLLLLPAKCWVEMDNLKIMKFQIHDDVRSCLESAYTLNDDL
ncbi:hypothetical protein [Pseudodesulfovibrio indicus]|uniref:hypothetical protein n=1 Tax=Pseudodesulfovibrio indicus TaxID=1716143 RepID=UPI000AF5C90D|nr:hypothetical protein [Pseudodesulfovibrio indicus]